MPNSSHYSARFRHTCAVSALSATAAAALVVVASPAAFADGKPDGKGRQPKPPAQMSEVGGAQLGQPGTQVEPRAGAPALPKKLTARSWIVSDAESGQVLASHNAHWKLAPASTLKMLFADTVLPKLPKDRKYKVQPEDLQGMGEGSSLVGVKEEETYAVHDLWLGVFLRSGNDAVHVLSAMNGGVDKTVGEMKAKARSLNATDTRVVSPDGYDHKGQVSSAYDLSLFARSGMQNADFRKYAATADAKFPGETKQEKKNGKKSGKKKRESFGIQNTNRLLTGDIGLDPYPGIAGVKNGTTTNAGSTFTGVAERNGRVLLVTVMHPEKGDGLEVYKETAKLLDWGFAADGKVTPVGRLAAPGSGSGAGGGGQAGGTAQSKAAHASKDHDEKPSGGAGVALGITGGCLVLLAAVAYAVHRRWPLSRQRR